MKKPSQREYWKKLTSHLSVPPETSAVICKAIITAPAFLSANRVATIFAARGHEPSLSRVWTIRPDVCYFPITHRDRKMLSFYKVKSLDDLVAGFGGVREPLAKPENAASDWGEGDLILVPGIAFDIWGGRLGSGLGIYDRFLGRAKGAKMWGVCFADTLSKERLEQDASDVRMGAIVSELGIKEVAV